MQDSSHGVFASLLPLGILFVTCLKDQFSHTLWVLLGYIVPGWIADATSQVLFHLLVSYCKICGKIMLQQCFLKSFVFHWWPENNRSFIPSSLMCKSSFFVILSVRYQVCISYAHYSFEQQYFWATFSLKIFPYCLMFENGCNCWLFTVFQHLTDLLSKNLRRFIDCYCLQPNCIKGKQTKGRNFFVHFENLKHHQYTASKYINCNQLFLLPETLRKFSTSV